MIHASARVCSLSVTTKSQSKQSNPGLAPGSLKGLKMNDSEMYFCLDASGELFILGDHGDFDAAEDTALSIGLNPIWILDRSTAKQWFSVLFTMNEGQDNE